MVVFSFCEVSALCQDGALSATRVTLHAAIAVRTDDLYSEAVSGPRSRSPRLAMNNSFTGRLGIPLHVALLMAAAFISVRISAQTDGPEFAQVIRRAHEYVVLYEDHELSTVMAREQYQQQWLDAR